MGSRRQITRQAAMALNAEDATLPLPEGAPYGAVLVDTDACTLCLSCVSLCPSGALGDNEDMPQLRFQEDACLQCGLCANVCPEQAITYEPRLNLSPGCAVAKVLHEEEPFACVECGALFGVKSTVERITEKLAGKHAMFANPQAARMIQMCDNCRVNAQFHQDSSPFQGADRPRVRTTEDYLSNDAITERMMSLKLQGLTQIRRSHGRDKCKDAFQILQCHFDRHNRAGAVFGERFGHLFDLREGTDGVSMQRRPETALPSHGKGAQNRKRRGRTNGIHPVGLRHHMAAPAMGKRKRFDLPPNCRRPC